MLLLNDWLFLGVPFKVVSQSLSYNWSSAYMSTAKNYKNAVFRYFSALLLDC